MDTKSISLYHMLFGIFYVFISYCIISISLSSHYCITVRLEFHFSTCPLPWNQFSRTLPERNWNYSLRLRNRYRRLSIRCWRGLRLRRTCSLSFLSTNIYCPFIFEYYILVFTTLLRSIIFLIINNWFRLRMWWYWNLESHRKSKL